MGGLGRLLVVALAVGAADSWLQAAGRRRRGSGRGKGWPRQSTPAAGGGGGGACLPSVELRASFHSACLEIWVLVANTCSIHNWLATSWRRVRGASDIGRQGGAVGMLDGAGGGAPDCPAGAGGSFRIRDLPITAKGVGNAREQRFSGIRAQVCRK